jgi:hypothetical protein
MSSVPPRRIFNIYFLHTYRGTQCFRNRRGKKKNGYHEYNPKPEIPPASATEFLQIWQSGCDIRVRNHHAPYGRTSPEGACLQLPTGAELISSRLAMLLHVLPSPLHTYWLSPITSTTRHAQWKVASDWVRTNKITRYVCRITSSSSPHHVCPRLFPI